MGYQANYNSRNFTRGTKAIAFYRATGADGIARCRNCTTRLMTGRIEYDHIIPFEISGYSGPSNCQVLCTGCHKLKTGERDIPQIAENNDRRDSHIGAHAKPRHPLPGGRKSRWSKPMAGGAPVPRVSQAEKLRAVLDRRQILTQQAEA